MFDVDRAWHPLFLLLNRVELANVLRVRWRERTDAFGMTVLGDLERLNAKCLWGFNTGALLNRQVV